MADCAVALNSNGKSEVDRARHPHLGDGQADGDHIQVAGGAPDGGEDGGDAEDHDGHGHIQQVKTGESNHKLVEVLHKWPPRKPDDANGITNDASATNK